MSNSYFQALPKSTQDALGESAFNAFIHSEPAFKWKGTWATLDDTMRGRWLIVCEAVMNALMGTEETVTGKMVAFIFAEDDMVRIKLEFEGIDLNNYSNNYQAAEDLRSKLAELDIARLKVVRVNNEAGGDGGGDGSTRKVDIPNKRKGT